MPKPPDANDAFIAGTLEDDPFQGEVISLPLPPEPDDVHVPSGGFRTTEIGNADRFLAVYGRDLRYCSATAGSGWLFWDGVRWRADRRNRVQELSKELSEHIRRDAATLKKEGEAAEGDARASKLDMASAILEWAKKSETAAKVKSTITLTASSPLVSIETDDLDADHWLFNCPTGTVDLRTGQQRHHRRTDLITEVAGAPYNPKATCPEWLKFLNVIMGNDATLVRYLQRAAGYSLVADRREQVMFILYGSGRNGKSTFINALRRAMGTYARGTRVDTFMAKREGGIPNDVAALASARLVSTSEPGEGKRLDESLVKQLTGGEPVSARFLNREFFEYTPKYAIWMGTNHRPRITGADFGIWRRLHLIPFEVTIPDAEVDPELDNTLRRETEGILAWAIAGCLAWQREGLSPPARVLAAIQEYRHDMDIVERFLEEVCIRAPKAEVENTPLFDAFARWLRRQGEQERSQSWFTRRLKEKKFEQFSEHSGPRKWRGLAVPGSPQTSAPYHGHHRVEYD